MFEKQKQQQLSRQDFSKKGSIDRRIAGLVRKINASDNYYTTSSCSGRILLLTEDKKQETRWLFASHDKIALNQLKSPLKTLPKKPLWFKFEPMILHIACRTLEDAQNIVDKARLAGFKWSGIMGARKRFLAEIKGTDFISTIISKNSRQIVNENYLSVLAGEANKKLKRNLEKIKRFEKSL